MFGSGSIISSSDESELFEIDYQIFALILLTVACFLGIYIQVRERQDLLKILESDDNNIRKIRIVANILTVTAAIFFVYVNSRTYKRNPNRYNGKYLLSSFLNLGATIITLIALLEGPPPDENEIEQPSPVE
jgi:hypothetical protein